MKIFGSLRLGLVMVGGSHPRVVSGLHVIWIPQYMYRGKQFLFAVVVLEVTFTSLSFFPSPSVPFLRMNETEKV